MLLLLPLLYHSQLYLHTIYFSNYGNKSFKIENKRNILLLCSFPEKSMSYLNFLRGGGGGGMLSDNLTPETMFLAAE